jgi:hypothetical protein
MAEYFHEEESSLQVIDIPFNVSHNQAVGEWNLQAAHRMRGISHHDHVVVFVTTHSDPDRGDLWTGVDRANQPCAVTVSNVSTGILYFIIYTDINHKLNSGLTRSLVPIQPCSKDPRCSCSHVDRW